MLFVEKIWQFCEKAETSFWVQIVSIISQSSSAINRKAVYITKVKFISQNVKDLLTTVKEFCFHLLRKKFLF